MPTNIAARQNIIQSGNIDWINVAVTTTPQKISDLLKAAGFHTRWGKPNMEAAERLIAAISFPSQDARPNLYLRRLAADTARRVIPDNFGVYIPAVNIYECFLSGESADTVTLELLLEANGDPA